MSVRPSFIFLSLLLFSGITACQKETPGAECVSTAQQTALLNALAPYAQDTTQMPAAERQLMNAIRAIANDLDALTSGMDPSFSVQEKYSEIRSRFLQHAAQAEQLATNFYGNNEAKIILAKNAFVLMSYDALTRKYPAFMWTRLGVFAANEVRSGLVLALTVQHNLDQSHMSIPVGNGLDMSQAMRESSEILIQGQIDVLTDIGSFDLLNSLTGPAALKNESWMTSEAREGFRIQEQAENALKQGQCNTYWDLQTAAAIRFGAHEQIYILQPMWDKPVMQQFAALDQMMMQLTGQQFVFFGDIFLGTNKFTEANKGYTIKLPPSVSDLSNATQRVQTAINGFNTLNRLRKDSKWNYWIDYSQIRIGYMIGTYSSQAL